MSRSPNRSSTEEAGRLRSEKSSTGTVKVLIADDEPLSRHSLIACLEGADYSPVVASDGQEALDLMAEDVLVAILDLYMPRLSGMECLQQIRQRYPDTQVIVISGAGQIADAVAAMKEGAIEYITKPIDPEELLIYVSHAIAQARLSFENRDLREAVGFSQPVEGFATRTAAGQELLRRIERVAQLDSNILITGESGTGKSTIARMVHQSGERGDRSFVAINCASLPRELIESELFGHAKGAFTGATKDRPGRAEIADGGTLFLDEIGDLPLDLQPKLLTFLQDHSLQRIGCNKVRHVDVRVITATHQDLAQLCREGRFREDLFYRLNVLGLHVPALRERRDDVSPLVQGVLERISRRRRCPPYTISSAALERLLSHDWPGNIRELENTLERATAFCEQHTITPNDIEFMGLQTSKASDRGSSASVSLAGRTLAEIERQAILDTLADCEGVKAECARRLGISEKSVYNKMRRHGLLPSE